MTNEFEKTIFSDYAFVGWVWTITHHHKRIDISSCPPEFLWLGNTGQRGWEMDAALREGWSLLGEDARAFATENLLPLCETWLRDQLLGVVRSRVPSPPLGEPVRERCSEAELCSWSDAMWENRGEPET